MSSQHKNIPQGYLVIRFVLDALRDQYATVGVAAWDSAKEWYGLRLVDEHETIKHVNKPRKALISMAEKSLKKWADMKGVPYAKGELAPWESPFWEAAGKVMAHSTRLSEPKSMNAMSNPEDGLERLYEAVVQPQLKKHLETPPGN